MELADHKLPDVSLVSLNGEGGVLVRGKGANALILGGWYPADLDQCLVVEPVEVLSIDVHTRALEAEADWDLADLTRGPDLGSQASSHGNYGRPPEVCSEVIKSIPLYVADLLSLVIRGVGAMSRAFLLEVCIGTLKWTLSFSNTHIEALESQFASRTRSLTQLRWS